MKPGRTVAPIPQGRAGHGDFGEMVKPFRDIERGCETLGNLSATLGRDLAKARFAPPASLPALQFPDFAGSYSPFTFGASSGLGASAVVAVPAGRTMMAYLS